MKNKKLEEFQNTVFKRVIFCVKSYTLLNAQEIKKIFSPPKLYGTSLYWLIFYDQREATPTKGNLIDSLAIVEIFIKASLLHKAIEEDRSFPSSTVVQGGQTLLLKNTRKILLGDMLITTAINTINSLTDQQIQKEFHTYAQKNFLNLIEKFLPQKAISQRKPYNWFSILPKLYQNGNKKDKKRKTLSTQLLKDLSSLDLGKVEERIIELKKSIT